MKPLITLLILTAGLSGYAQYGSIAGKILNEQGEGLPKTTVELTNSSNGYTKIFNSDADGNFDFHPVPAGTYNIKFTCKRYNLKELAGVLVTADRQTWLNVQLEVLPKKKN